MEWSKLPAVPDAEGFAGMYAGVSHGSLLVAGGANFPDKKPWEGGKKVWYDTVYALDDPSGTWNVVGKLPRRLGYGVSVTYHGRMVCVGGSDSGKQYADTLAVELVKGRVRTTNLPPLPMTLANGCGALVGGTLFVAGGQARPDSTTASARVFALDLDAKDPVWHEMPPLPGPGRILATAAACGGKFFVVGGASLHPGAKGGAERTYLRDGYGFDGHRWTRIADLPAPSVAAPSPAPVTGNGFLLLGGDDGSQVGKPQQDHPGFPSGIWLYDVAKDAWVPAGQSPAPRVTLPSVPWAGGWALPNGERHPGVRSPEVWLLKP